MRAPVSHSQSVSRGRGRSKRRSVPHCSSSQGKAHRRLVTGGVAVLSGARAIFGLLEPLLKRYASCICASLGLAKAGALVGGGGKPIWYLLFGGGVFISSKYQIASPTVRREQSTERFAPVPRRSALPGHRPPSDTLTPPLTGLLTDRRATARDRDTRASHRMVLSLGAAGAPPYTMPCAARRRPVQWRLPPQLALVLPARNVCGGPLGRGGPRRRQHSRERETPPSPWLHLPPWTAPTCDEGLPPTAPRRLAGSEGCGSAGPSLSLRPDRVDALYGPTAVLTARSAPWLVIAAPGTGPSGGCQALRTRRREAAAVSGLSVSL